MKLSENAHLLRYPYPSSLRRTSMYASFLGISEALQLNIFHQLLRSRFFESPDFFLDKLKTWFSGQGQTLLVLPVKIVSCFGVLEFWSLGVLEKARD